MPARFESSLICQHGKIYSNVSPVTINNFSKSQQPKFSDRRQRPREVVFFFFWGGGGGGAFAPLPPSRYATELNWYMHVHKYKMTRWQECSNFAPLVSINIPVTLSLSIYVSLKLYMYLHSCKFCHSDDATCSNETLVLKKCSLLFCVMVLSKAICWAIIFLTRTKIKC